MAIIDPRTGEILQRWNGFLEPQDMTEKRAWHGMIVAESALTPFLLRNAFSVGLLLHEHV